ncbi:caspase-6 [Culex quinquefasciatus]|uniref:Caspase-6 n=1 Tax=Culex quinquefasciatus TaxID=7176 RepID=B0XBV7_CULQU|nr:caspase-6 [Culex quinquefasciatus]|eukprot:XP_001867129.1 caspase-6 [Culex quinquefasciatus]
MFSTIRTSVDPSSKRYSMESRLRGKVLIFNQREFTNGYSPRVGTEKDVERLLQTLPLLGYAREHIKVFENQDASDIEAVAGKCEHFWNEFVKTDAELNQCDSLVVFFLTHGEQNDRLVARDETFHLYEFIEHFTPAALPAMAGKPKLFVVQACRGGRLDRGVQLQSLVSGLASTLVSRFRFDTGSFVGANLVGGRRYTCPVQDNRIFSYPEFADFLIAMSSHHGHVSFRNAQGSWYIQELCNVIESFDPDDESILDILTATNSAVSRRVSNVDGRRNNKKQISSFYSTLTKKLYFMPRPLQD